VNTVKDDPRIASLGAARQEAGLFLDIDGVLAPIQQRPELASVPPAVRDLVRRLTDCYRLVAAVSGRRAADATALMDVPGVLVIGNHGMESLRADGSVVAVGSPALARVEQAAAELRARADLAAAGVRIEDKGAGVALHVRGAPDEQAAWELVCGAAGALAERLGLQALPGRAVVDLRPPGIDKGTAVRSLVAAEGLRAALYVGDDRTDADALRALQDLRGQGLLTLAVAVTSPEAPAELLDAADLVITIAQVPDLLTALLEAACSSPSSPSV